MTTLAAVLLAGATLAICWKLPYYQLQRIAGQGLVLWPPSFALGFAVADNFFSLALFFALAPLFLWIRSLWSDDDSDEGPEDLWDFVPHNPLSGKRSKEIL